jgi:hypothetical protein
MNKTYIHITPEVMESYEQDLHSHHTIGHGELWTRLTFTSHQRSWRATNKTYIHITPQIMERFIFWKIRSYSPLKVNRRFGGTYRLYLQGWISRENACVEASGRPIRPVSNGTYSDISQRITETVSAGSKHRSRTELDSNTDTLLACPSWVRVPHCKHCKHSHNEYAQYIYIHSITYLHVNLILKPIMIQFSDYEIKDGISAKSLLGARIFRPEFRKFASPILDWSALYEPISGRSHAACDQNVTTVTYHTNNTPRSNRTQHTKLHRQ